jgi:hypothetical protein
MTDTVDVAATEVDPLESKILTLKFSVKDINAILNLLGTLPFVQSVGLINAIQAQCAPQVNEEAPSEPQAAA